MIDTVALFSSARHNGNTRQLLNAVYEQTAIDIFDLSKYEISAYDYQHNNIDDDFLPLITKVLTYDKIIFASPVSWYSVTPAMKAFLDRISDLLDLPDLLDLGRTFRGKQAYVLATSIRKNIATPYINSFKLIFDYLGMEYGGYLHANCVDGYRGQDYQTDLRHFLEVLN